MKGKGMAIAGMVLGIVALVVCWWGVASFAGLPLAIVGLVLSCVGGKKIKAAGGKSGIATAGLVIGIIAVVLTAFTFIYCGLCPILVLAAAA